MSRAGPPPLHAVTDDRVLSGGSGFLETARDVLRAGGPDLALHLRGPASSGALLYELARELRSVARESGGRLVINDRVDVALTVGADGVHLGRRSLPPATARELLKSDEVLVGASVHSIEEAGQARDEGADYLFLGTIFTSSSHPDRPPAGIALLREVAKLVSLPLIAIGGMEPDRVGEVIDAGAGGVASISAIWDAREPVAAVDDFLRALSRAPGRNRGNVSGENRERHGNA